MGTSVCNMTLKATLLFSLADREAFLSLLLRVVSFISGSTVHPQKIYSQHLLSWMVLTQTFIMANKFLSPLNFSVSYLQHCFLEPFAILNRFSGPVLIICLIVRISFRQIQYKKRVLKKKHYYGITSVISFNTIG